MREKVLERLKLSDNMMAHRPMIRIVDMVLEMTNDGVINDKAMQQEMEDDLQNNYNYTIKEAKEWVEDNGSAVVSDMWDAYSRYLEENAIYKG